MKVTENRVEKNQLTVEILAETESVVLEEKASHLTQGGMGWRAENVKYKYWE